jgi:hypothetical protein
MVLIVGCSAEAVGCAVGGGGVVGRRGSGRAGELGGRASRTSEARKKSPERSENKTRAEREQSPPSKARIRSRATLPSGARIKYERSEENSTERGEKRVSQRSEKKVRARLRSGKRSGARIQSGNGGLSIRCIDIRMYSYYDTVCPPSGARHSTSEARRRSLYAERECLGEQGTTHPRARCKARDDSKSEATETLPSAARQRRERGEKELLSAARTRRATRGFRVQREEITIKATLKAE